MTRSAVKALTMAAPAATSSTASGLLQRKCACGGEAGFDGECEECGREKLQRKPAGASGLDRVPPIVHDTLRSPGEQLPHPVRAFFEQRFNHDFGRVRVHCGSKADASARAVDALAYTIGQDVVFGAGRYRPDTEAGLRLIAHELTHTIQQERNRPTGVEAQAAAEIEAEHNAKALATEHEPMQHAHSHPRAVLRQSKKPPLKRDPATDAQNVFWRIVHENFRKDGRKLAGTGYDEKNQGLRISGQSSWTRTPGKAGGEQTVEAGPSPMIMVGSGFRPTAAYLADKPLKSEFGDDGLKKLVKEVGDAIEKVDQWRVDHAGIDAEDLGDPKIIKALEAKTADDTWEHILKTRYSEVRDKLTEILVGKLSGSDSAQVFDYIVKTRADDARTALGSSLGKVRAALGDALIERLTDSDLDKAPIVEWLRALKKDRIEEYKGKTKAARVKRMLGNLLVISTPTDQVIDQQGAHFTIGQFRVVLLRDQPTQTAGSGGATGATFKSTPDTIPRADWDKHNKIKGFPGFSPRYTIEIATVYFPDADPEAKSGYGRGTTKADIAAGATSLRFHEGTHGLEIIDLLKTTQLPEFKGKNGMDKDAFDKEVKTYTAALDDFKKTLREQHIQFVDCVGDPTIDVYQKRKNPSFDQTVCKPPAVAP